MLSHKLRRYKSAAAQPTDANFSSVSLLLHGDGTNGGQNNTFLDSSTNNFTITRSGNTTQGTFSPFPLTTGVAYSASTNGGSGYFDGSGDRLTCSSSAFALGTGDFTVEMWIYWTAIPGSDTAFIGGLGSGSGSTIGIYNFGANITLVKTGGGTFVLFGSKNQLTINQWNHLAITRSGNSHRCFINGTLDTAGAITSAADWATPTTTTYVGSAGTSNYFNGYMSNIRVILGTALYTSNFTPSTAPLTAVTNTSLLLSGTNAAIIDNAGKNVLETVGNAQIDTGTKQFGTGSLEFDGTGDWLLAPNTTATQLGTGTFTVELWVYLATGDIGSNRGLISKGTSTTGWSVSLNTTEKVVFSYTSSTITSSGAITSNAWNHIAVVREGTGSNQTKIYINGTNDGTGTVSTDFNQTNSLYVGANRVGGDPMKGFIDDVRVTKGVARYSANFTAPTAAFPDNS
jgi:hypothetical protein